ncbi:hypothetical protein VPH35_103525 [Triticum aestivum]
MRINHLEAAALPVQCMFSPDDFQRRSTPCNQMASCTSYQVVRLTWRIDVLGHMAMLVRVMIETGYRWYPEYTVEEQYRNLSKASTCASSGYTPRILELPILSTGRMGSELLSDVCSGYCLFDDDHNPS